MNGIEIADFEAGEVALLETMLILANQALIMEALATIVPTDQAIRLRNAAARTAEYLEVDADE